MSSGQPAVLVRYLDVALVVVAAPIMLLIGVPGAGYGIAAGAWIVLRTIGIGVELAASRIGEQGPELTLRLSYMLGRLFLLALTVILVRRGDGKDAGLTALLVIVVAFTVQLGASAVSRPRSR